MVEAIDPISSFAQVVALTRARIFFGDAPKDVSDVPATTQLAAEGQATLVKEMSPLCPNAAGLACQTVPSEDKTSAAPELRCASVLPTATHGPPDGQATS